MQAVQKRSLLSIFNTVKVRANSLLLLIDREGLSPSLIHASNNIRTVLLGIVDETRLYDDSTEELKNLRHSALQLDSMVDMYSIKRKDKFVHSVLSDLSYLIKKGYRDVV